MSTAPASFGPSAAHELHHLRDQWWCFFAWALRSSC